MEKVLEKLKNMEGDLVLDERLRAAMKPLRRMLEITG